MAKYVVFERDDGWYLTGMRNYKSYVQSPDKIHKLEGLKDPRLMIDMVCMFNPKLKPSDFHILPISFDFYELYARKEN